MKINSNRLTKKAYAKVNIFLKITGHEDGYHTLLSRFVKVDTLYDTISFAPYISDTFTIEGCDNIPIKSNTIYKAYVALSEHTGDTELLDFFYKHKVIVKKNIPSGAGLGGGSSDAATFMLLAKEACNLLLTTKELAKIGSTIGADIPFFIYEYTSANVSGFGDIVESFKEEKLAIEIFTPPTSCDTTAVYKNFKRNHLQEIELCSFMGWGGIESRKLLEFIGDPLHLNDLYISALDIYPELQAHQKDGWFFSGSGSSFFRILTH